MTTSANPEDIRDQSTIRASSLTIDSFAERNQYKGNTLVSHQGIHL